MSPIISPTKVGLMKILDFKKVLLEQKDDMKHLRVKIIFKT